MSINTAWLEPVSLSAQFKQGSSHGETLVYAISSDTSLLCKYIVLSTIGVSTPLQEFSGNDPSSRERYDCARKGPATWLLESRRVLLLLTTKYVGLLICVVVVWLLNDATTAVTAYYYKTPLGHLNYWCGENFTESRHLMLTSTCLEPDNRCLGPPPPTSLNTS